jgi:hypothetical protein
MGTGAGKVLLPIMAVAQVLSLDLQTKEERRGERKREVQSKLLSSRIPA